MSQLLRRLWRNLAGATSVSGATDAHLPQPARGAREVFQLLQEGYRLHGQGDGAGAERCYREVLEIEEGNVDALHLLGRLMGQSGRYAEAESALRSALEAMPGLGEAHCDLGAVLQSMGRVDEALASYRSALAADPSSASANYNIGCLLRAQGMAEEGLRHLRAAHESNPADLATARALANALLETGSAEEVRGLVAGLPAELQQDAALRVSLGLALATLGREDEATGIFTRVADENADSADASHYLGLALWRLGRTEAAEENLVRAIDLDPSRAKAHSDLGQLLHQLGRDAEAIDCFQLALHYDPGMAEARRGLGYSLLASERVAEARAAFREDIAARPHFQGYFGLARSYQSAGELEEAETSYLKALELAPEYVQALNNLGLVYRELGRFDDAVGVFERALAAAPGFLPARANLGLAFYDMGEMDRAVECFERVLARQPDYDEALWNLAVARLAVGNFERGWDDYDKRWLRKEANLRPYPWPEWDGSDLAGKTLLVYAEQGLGDEIMFASCLPEVIAAAARCYVECDPRLAKLFSRSFPDAVVRGGKSRDGAHARPESWAGVDLQSPIGNLPRYLRRSLSAFPRHSGYLRADPERVRYWRERLVALGPGLKVGISWRGGTPSSRRRLRSISLPDLTSLLAVPGTHFCSLQYGDVAADLAQLRDERGIALPHWQEAIDDYDETAALVCALDLVVSVCTAVIHLTGALGRTAWILVPASPEWRYQRSGETMPWYPAHRLFRQRDPNDWAPVLAAVHDALAARADGEK